jgi:ribosomal RNA assembly protein
MQEIVLIPHERVGVLIGKGGKTKEKLERKSSARIKIEEQEVIINCNDPEILMKTMEVVKAIARGFSPEHAFLLLEEGFELAVITLQGENHNTVKRLMARVIGKKGATKRIIEEETNCLLSVYGKTVSLIGKQPELSRAETSVEEILRGRSHGYVYAKLKKK